MPSITSRSGRNSKKAGASPKRLLSPTEILERLIAIPSVNPVCDPQEESQGEGRLASFLGEFLEKLGAEVRYQEVAPGRPNVVATWQGSSGSPHLAFAPHTDTVGVSGMTVDPFRPVEKNGRIYGRGASDTKGPMASLLWALQRWSRAGRTLREGLQVTFAALMGEEAGNEGAIALAESGFRADLVVVCEPTNLKVVYAHKGAFWFELLALGKACHGSTPEKGINAIEVMAEVFPGVKKQLLRELSRRPSPLGPATLNFGVIQGGSAINIVPDRCRLLCDLRFPPSWRPEEILRILRRGKKAWGRRVRWKLLRKAPGLACDPKHPWIAKLAEAGRGLATAPWFCDAAIFAQKGLSAVAFGPGSIAQAHTADEFISKKELTEGALAYWSFLQKVARAE